MLATITATLLLLVSSLVWYRTARPLHAFHRDAFGRWSRLSGTELAALVTAQQEVPAVVAARPGALYDSAA